MLFRWFQELIYWASFVVLVCSLGCNQTIQSGSTRISIVHPSNGHCQYTVGPVNFQTLENISNMTGKVGRVLHSSNNLDKDPNTLATGQGLTPVDTEFFRTGDTYFPANLDSLFAASLYYSIENGYLLTKTLDPTIDLASIVPNFRDTRIVHRAIRSESSLNIKKEISDNAEYLSVRSGSQVLNYFFSYPTDTVTDIPLGLNMGIMNHEFSHLVFQHLFYEPGIKRNLNVGSTKPTTHSLAALDEGLADYFGFLATQDPGYFLCTFPQENRDLSRPKYFTSGLIAGIDSNSDDYFDSHQGGAVFASIQYEIGQTLGNHQVVGKSLLNLMSSLLTCPSTVSGNTLNFNFGDIAKCHLSLLSSDSRAQGVARQIYQKYLGSYGVGL